MIRNLSNDSQPNEVTRDMTDVAEVIAQTLKQAGVGYAFGIPGGGTVPLIEGLRRAGIPFVVTRHETAAAFMADAHARLARRPGVCVSTLGPGATNLVTGVAHAFLDRAPVLALTGQIADDVYPVHTHQRVDIQSLMRPITKLSTVLHPTSAGEVVADALRVAQTPRQGPVHVQVNEDLGQLSASEVIQRLSFIPPIGSTGALDEAMRLVAKAHRPAIVAGLGLEPEAPYPALQNLAEHLGAPVVLTPKAKGAFPADHPYYAGVIGLVSREAPFDLLQCADLILAVGLDTVELVHPWPLTQPLLWIDPAPNTEPTVPATVELRGQMGPVLEALASVPWSGSLWTEAELAAAQPTWPTETGDGRLVPTQVMQVLRAILPREAIVTCDVGAHKLLIGKYWPALSPNSFLISNGLSSMGYALPAAIGAKLAAPDRPVVCLAGDGGMAMTVAELETACRLGLDLVCIVLVDDALSLIRLKQTAQDLPPTGTEFGQVDFARVAEGYGARGDTVEDAASLREAVSQALRHGGPTLVAARISGSEYTEF